MKTLKFFCFGCALIALQACSSETPTGLQVPGFGDAVRQNIAAQTVNPTAPQDPSPIMMDAQRAAIQQNRYTTDTVEQPMDVGTLQGASSGGGGGGGGGGAGAGGGGAR